jgi:methionyl aminopeptidase
MSSETSTDNPTSAALCNTTGCGKPSKLRCPTCIKQNITDGSHFCSQECFTQFWSMHKLLHLPGKKAAEFNPWPGFKFTGPLRPFPLSAKRLVPAHIPRPDYADDAQGRPFSEIAERGSTTVKVLDDEEIAGLKVACKLAREVLDEAAKAAAVGVTTDELDRIVHEAAIERECYPSPLNYYNFPKSVCT